MFDEYDEKAEVIEKFFENSLRVASDMWDISYKHPIPKLTKTLLNEIVEFNPLEDGGEE